MKFNRQLNLNKKNDAFQSYFRLLGLMTGECRTNVIRSAAQAMSAALGNRSEHHVDNQVQSHAEDVRRAKIALAAYRLLDPRERTDDYERVQLCYPIDRDDAETYSPPVGKLLDQMPTLKRPTGRGVKLMVQPLIDDAMDDGSFDDDEPGAAKPESLELRANELSLDERRGVVRLLRESEESSLRGLSPLGWLRSRLGI